ncbi:MAG TPA: S8 family peptidase [Elusimicrobiota bacterium]|nr:S8 family peptidase [Elusimicrobiota bacterium]
MVRVARAWGFLALSLMVLAVASNAADMTRRIVVFAPGTTAAQRLALAKSTGAQIVRELPLINAVVIETPADRVSASETKLTAMAEVARIDQDPKINWLKAVDAPGVDFRLPNMDAIMAPLRALKSSKAAAAPAPASGSQAIQWGVNRVNAPAAWKKTRGAGVKVAVIDTGLDKTHPDLAGNIKGGWNAIAKSSDFNDDHGHGTHCGGNIAALDNDIGIVGVAPKVDLYGVKVLDANGSGTFDDVIAGMQWAVDNHMDVASMSLGADQGNQALADMVAAMKKGGVTLVAAAGNSGGAVGFPGGYPEAIAVAAMCPAGVTDTGLCADANEGLAVFSSRGPEVAVIAPGVNVYSLSMNGGYDTMSGTSMATPHVAGLAALYVATHKGATPDQVRAALAAASTKLPGVIPEGQGAGLPDAAKLVQ